MPRSGVRIVIAGEDQAHRALTTFLADRVLLDEALKRSADWIELGFDPPEEPHRLTAHPNDARTDAKRVLRILVTGEDASRPPALEEIPDLCDRTLNDLGLLERRGVACGLAAFLGALRSTLVPRFIPGPE